MNNMMKKGAMMKTAPGELMPGLLVAGSLMASGVRNGDGPRAITFRTSAAASAPPHWF